jgi:hypothetical protein
MDDLALAFGPITLSTALPWLTLIQKIDFHFVVKRAGKQINLKWLFNAFASIAAASIYLAAYFLPNDVSETVARLGWIAPLAVGVLVGFAAFLFMIKFQPRVSAGRLWPIPLAFVLYLLAFLGLGAVSGWSHLISHFKMCQVELTTQSRPATDYTLRVTTDADTVAVPFDASGWALYSAVKADQPGAVDLEIIDGSTGQVIQDQVPCKAEGTDATVP